MKLPPVFRALSSARALILVLILPLVLLAGAYPTHKYAKGDLSLDRPITSSPNDRMMFRSGDAGNDSWLLANANGNGGTASWTHLFPTGGPATGSSSQGAVYDFSSIGTTVFFTSPSSTNEIWALTTPTPTLGNCPNTTVQLGANLVLLHSLHKRSI
jgi:hypothetical protein